MPWAAHRNDFFLPTHGPRVVRMQCRCQPAGRLISERERFRLRLEYRMDCDCSLDLAHSLLKVGVTRKDCTSGGGSLSTEVVFMPSQLRHVPPVR